MLEKATAELRQAEKAYGKLVGLNTAAMTEEQLKGHRQACQAALKAKREAQQKVRNTKLGKG